MNIPNHYEFEKTDHRHKPLSGVHFGLYDDKGTFIRELVSDENGIVRADNLVPGSYLIRETRPLDGYDKTDEEITFIIDESYVPPQKLVRITNKLAGLIFLIACCCLLVGKVTFREAAAMFAGSFCVFVLPYAAEWILERVSDLNQLIKDWVRG